MGQYVYGDYETGKLWSFGWDAKAKKVLDARKIRDWTDNRDVENAMMNDLDDLMFAVKGRYDLPLTGEDIDEILEVIIRVAKRRETQQ